MLDARAASIIVATLIFGPPQAAPLAMRVLESDLSKAFLLVSVGHIGSALVFFLFFQAIRPLVERVKNFFVALWLRIASDQKGPERPSRSLLFNTMVPGRKYFFLGSVAFVFAFGSFLGVAATQAVGMKRTMAFLSVMLGCTLSVIFWVTVAFYLTKMVEPGLVALGFVLFAAALMWRGKILQNRIVRELTNLGTDSFKVLLLLADHVSLSRISEKTQIGMDQLGLIIENLTERGYIIQGGREAYQLTKKGLMRLRSLPNWIHRLLELEIKEEE